MGSMNWGGFGIETVKEGGGQGGGRVFVGITRSNDRLGDGGRG